jgi:LysR family glycine cleavage system transcriptional activator
MNRKRVFLHSMTTENLSLDEDKHRPLRSLSGLVDFEASARLASFKLAAESLHKTPAAVSLQVRQLEATLGFALFARHARRVDLTDRGKAFAEVVTRTLADLRAKAQALREVDDEALLRITTTHSFALKWLAPRIGRFTARHSDLDVRVAASDLPADLSRGDADVALRYGALRADDPSTLWREHLVAVVAPKLLLPSARRAARPGVAVLARLPLLYEGSRETWTRFLDAHGISVKASAFSRGFSHSGLLAQAAIAGQGAALVPYAMVHDDLAAGALRRLATRAWSNGMGYRFLVDEQRSHLPRFLALRDWLDEEMDGMRTALGDCTADRSS